MQEKEDKLLTAMLLDKYRAYEKTGISSYSNFLNPKEVEMLENVLRGKKIPYGVNLPNDACERYIIYFGEYENFVSFYRIPISSVKHSDVLGALFASGFSISMIGDIFIEEDNVYLTNLEKYDFLLETMFTKIGKNSIKLEKITELPYIPKKFQDLSFSVSSTRIDLILSKIMKTSRSKTLEYMNEKQVIVNYKPISKNVSLQVGDVFSIEKVGKFIVREIEKSKSGKLRVLIQKYC